VVLKEVASGKPSAEVGYWTAAQARGRGVAPRAVEALTGWAFDAPGADGLEQLELLHQVDNPTSCRVAHKSGYDLDTVLPAAPPSFPARVIYTYGTYDAGTPEIHASSSSDLVRLFMPRGPRGVRRTGGVRPSRPAPKTDPQARPRLGKEAEARPPSRQDRVRHFH
jgi:hypothetical protein